MENTSLTSAAKKHYDSFLASHYSWMCGDLDLRIQQAAEFFQEHQIVGPEKIALDLGCGSGIQSCALATLGFEVTAIDFNEQLLEELQTHHSGDSLRIICADLTQLSENLPSESDYDLVVCMGDTLTHLPSRKEVEKLFATVSRLLQKSNGKFILSFRDLSFELTGTDRAIPVKLDDEKLMLTFLEYGKEQVSVHDMVLTKKQGEWSLEKSSYPKLRITLSDVLDILSMNHFEISFQNTRQGFCEIIAERIPS